MSDKDDRTVAEQAKTFKLDNLDIRSPENQKKAQKIHHRHWERIQFFIDEQERKLSELNIRTGRQTASASAYVPTISMVPSLARTINWAHWLKPYRTFPTTIHAIFRNSTLVGLTACSIAMPLPRLVPACAALA